MVVLESGHVWFPPHAKVWDDGEFMDTYSACEHASMYQTERFDECEIAPAEMSRNSQTPTTWTPWLEETAKHESIVPEILEPDEDLSGPYNFRVIPPTPNEAETSTLEKQEAPEKVPSNPHVETGRRRKPTRSASIFVLEG